MRSDFGKCVIERPRRGSSNPSEKARRYGKFVVDKEDGSIDYEGFTKLPSSRGDRVRGDYKEFTDVLGPIEGYLRSSCGRRWDDVFSELSQLLGKASWSLRHIMTAHLDVAVNTYISKSGHICNASKYGPQFIEPTVQWHRNDFYVDPRSGILKAWPRKKPESKREPSQYELDVFEEAAGFNVKDLDTGAWFLCDLAASENIYKPSYPARPYRRPGEIAPPSVRSLLSGNILTYKDQYHRSYTAEYYFRRRKSLNKKEIQAMLARRDAKLRQRYPNYK